MQVWLVVGFVVWPCFGSIKQPAALVLDPFLRDRHRCPCFQHFVAGSFVEILQRTTSSGGDQLKLVQQIGKAAGAHQ